MTDWAAGYVASIDYTHGYYPELNPLQFRLAFLYNGLKPPAVGTACELGFGQGLSTNLHAAASVTQWYGTDFLPSQALFAQELSDASGAAAKLFADSFAEFLKRRDIPDFDFICLHGIWCWVSEDNRKTILDFIDRKLKVGGVVYLSYNSAPGWAVFGPIQHLLKLHDGYLGASADKILSRVDSAMNFARSLLATNPPFVSANPKVEQWLSEYSKQDKTYLAHEFFNDHWRPMYFSEVANDLQSIRLQFACSANFVESVSSMNFTEPQLSLMQSIPDVGLRESTRDMMANQIFRRDYWVKGARSLSVAEKAAAFRQLSVVLVVPRSSVVLKVRSGLGIGTMDESICGGVLDVLADNRPRTLHDIETALHSTKIGLNDIVHAVLVLAGKGEVVVAQDAGDIMPVKLKTDRLNAYLLGLAKGSGTVEFLASPVTGGGIKVGRYQQLFLLARASGRKSPAEWAGFAMEILRRQGQRVAKGGVELDTDAAGLEVLIEQATLFAAKDLPVLTALMVAP